jgi:hypothetical protein
MPYPAQVAATIAAAKNVTPDDRQDDRQVDAFGHVDLGLYDYHDDYGTPDREFLPLKREFEFEWDLAACADNFKLPNWIGPDHTNRFHRDSLEVPWYELTQPGGLKSPGWLNAPFRTRLLAAFMKKAALETTLGARVVTILPAHRTEQKWWQDYVLGYAREIRSIKGRTKYELHGRALEAWLAEERARARLKGREPKTKPMSPNFPSCIAIFDGPRKAPPIIVPWDPET